VSVPGAKQGAKQGRDAQEMVCDTGNMRKLPIGEQDFAKIRRTGALYVDKTARIHDLLTGSGSQFFLSRPRRFGKSLLCSTLGALFAGKRELFTWQAIDGLEWDWTAHPVIHIDLNAADYARGMSELDARLGGALDDAARDCGVPLRGESNAARFSGLIRDSAEKMGAPAAVIIDEYDKPLIATLEDRDSHGKMLSALKAFYGVLKSADQYLQFVFLTGVTKFSHVSVFSDLNHLTDISLFPQYADLCGITQKELEHDFAPEIDAVIAENGLERQDYLDKLKRFYNGYRFSRKPLTVYNPYGLLKHFNEEGQFVSYWFASGTPTFLVNLIQNQHLDITQLENYTIGQDAFAKFDLESLEAVPVLFQAGYLTITDYDREFGRFTLDYPNEEVRSGFAQCLATLWARRGEVDSLTDDFPVLLATGKIDEAMETLQSFLAGIPNTIQIQQEKYYQTVLHVIFRMFGLCCISEVATASGRIDTVMEFRDRVYCFEFKLDKSAEEAYKQIGTKKYLLPWRDTGKRLFKIGVNFDSKERTISEWKWHEARRRVPKVK
jgi:hypothetical protein